MTKKSNSTSRTDEEMADLTLPSAAGSGKTGNKNNSRRNVTASTNVATPNSNAGKRGGGSIFNRLPEGCCSFCLSNQGEMITEKIPSGHVVCLHEECVTWTSGVWNDRGKWMNLEREIPASRRRRCAHCRQVGASMGCNKPECTKVYHIPCAFVSGVTVSTTTDPDKSFRCWCPDHAHLATEEYLPTIYPPTELDVEIAEGLRTNTTSSKSSASSSSSSSQSSKT